jgi:predicted AAA+ superfamily ATPase
MQENVELVQKGFRILLPQLSGYIGMEMSRVYGDDWWREVLDALSDQYDLPASGEYGDLLDSLDIANCLRLIDRRWRDVFSQKMSKSYRNLASELMGVRNAVSHAGSNDLQQAYTERALDTMALLCEPIDGEATEEIRAIYRKVRYGNEQGSTANKENAAPADDAKPKKKTASAAVLTKNVGKNLPSWRDVMEPHPDVAEGRYKAAEFAADLAQVARGEGAYEYRDPVEFFARTYVTEGMAGLLVESLKRVTGQGGEPVIQLKTAFGGGKTHSMLALYHMLHGKTSIEYIPNLKPVLDRVGLTELPKANVAVLVGTALDPTRKKNPANLPGYTVSTIWGEMAYQLVTSAEKPELYAKYIREADRKGVSPGSENLKNLFNECGPCLVLMDELVAYAKKLYGVDGLPAGSYDNFVTFIQEITEAARASENSLVVASIPESDIEIGGTAGKTVLDTIEHTFGRMESIWKPVAANEGFEVVRRRLFLDCKNPEARDAVCEAFSKMYQENPSDFPLEAKEVEYKQRLISCYPIHPEVFDRLYGDWATLERFQRTRGVLRLMAAVIHELWMANDESAMIMPGSIPLDTPNVRDELVRHLPDTWNSIIDREVDGKQSIPYQKDKDNPRYGQSLACRRIARTIMLGSAPSTSAIRDQGIRGLEISRILLGTVQPDENIANFRDALNTLHGSLSYLYNNPNGNRFWYDTKPTLRKTAEDRASQISQADVEMEVESRLKKIRRENPFAGIHACPASSNDVPDDQAVRLVILRPRDTYKRNSKTCFAMEKVEDILNNRGTSPRVYKNMLAFMAPDMDKIGAVEQEVKRFKAWTSIMSDKDDLNLDGGQVRETDNNLKRSNDTVDARLKEAYCWLLVPYIDQYGDMKTVQWEISDVGGGNDSLPTKASRKMLQAEQIITKWAPALLQMCLDDILWKDSNDISVKKLWDYLTTYCYLPRLSSYSVLEETICQGVASTEYFALAAAFNGERYIDLKFNKSVFSINPSDLLVKIDVAKKQIEAERKADEERNNEGSGQPSSWDVAGGSGSSSTGGYSPSGNGTSTVEEGTNEVGLDAVPKNKHFYMSVKLDNTRVNRDMNNYVQEIIQHLMSIDGADVEMKLEVQVQAPNGIPSTTVRTVSENCKTLKVDDFGFDD